METKKNTLEFFYNPMSRAAIVHWMLEEIGEPYEVKLIDFQTGKQKAPDYLAVNPCGKVPAIRHNGRAITETAAILTYLAEAFPKAGLSPEPGSPEKGEFLRWMFFISSCLEPSILEKDNPRIQPVPDSRLGWPPFEQVMKIFSEAFTRKDSNGALSNGRFSAADIFLSLNLYWMMEFGMMEKQQVFLDYVNRWSSRPAFERTQAQSKKFEKLLEERR